MSAPEVVIYLTSWCPYCVRARALLERKGIPFTTIDLDGEPERRAEMEQRSGRTSVPQIFIGERHVGGYDELYSLDATGGLDPLLKTGA